jgi:aspartate aminotransferase
VPLRKAVAAWIGKAHGLTIDPGEVIVSSGAKQSIYNAVFALIDEGDEVIIPTPAWVSYNDIVKLAGGRPVNVPDQGRGELPGAGRGRRRRRSRRARR